MRVVLREAVRLGLLRRGEHPVEEVGRDGDHTELRDDHEGECGSVHATVVLGFFIRRMPAR